MYLIKQHPEDVKIVLKSLYNILNQMACFLPEPLMEVAAD